MILIPAMRGKIGSTEYFVATMKASEVVNTIRIPKEMPDWGNESIEERYQREINYKRVKEQIAPYLAMDPDRFFNALIVDILDPEEVKFDKLSDAIKNIPSYMGSLGDNFGVLTLQGNERLVPLDGQHRLAALRFALYGRDEADQPIDSFNANPDIAKDDITLVLVKHDRIKARKIFSKVNRYAKAVSKADNLIISEDDYMAMLSRGLANDVFLSLVNSKSNTIPEKSNDITTLSVIYEACVDYMSESVFYPTKVTVDFLPNPATQALWKTEIYKLWESLLSDIPILADAVRDPNATGKDIRIELRRDYIIMRPVVQHAVVIAIKRLLDDGSSLKAVLNKLGIMDWRYDNSEWERIAVKPGNKIIAGRSDTKLLARVIAYRLGESLSAKELKVLEDQYRGLFDVLDVERQLPSLIN
jgi:DNA sulfur modification protein DndB